MKFEQLEKEKERKKTKSGFIVGFSRSINMTSVAVWISKAPSRRGHGSNGFDHPEGVIEFAESRMK